MLALIEKFELQLLSEDDYKFRIANKAICNLIENISVSSQSKQQDILARLLEPLFINIVHGNGSTVYETWKKGVILLSKHDSGKQFIEKHLKNLSSHLGTHLAST